jgi:hypothetical protein
MSIEAWQWSYTAGNDGGAKTKRCMFGEESEGICTFGIFVSFIGFLAAIFFIGGEFVIEKASLLIYRKQYYFFDLAFSGESQKGMEQGINESEGRINLKLNAMSVCGIFMPQFQRAGHYFFSYAFSCWKLNGVTMLEDQRNH